MIPTDCDALHYTCGLCGHHTCADQRPSPQEHNRICDDCSVVIAA